MAPLNSLRKGHDAKFRDSRPVDLQRCPRCRTSAPPPHRPAVRLRRGGDRQVDRDIIAELRHLTVEQVEQVLRCQREKGLRFGEAAVCWAWRHAMMSCSHFPAVHYPYAPEERRVSTRTRDAERAILGCVRAFRALRSQLMMRLFAMVSRVVHWQSSVRKLAMADLLRGQPCGRARPTRRPNPAGAMQTCVARDSMRCSSWRTALACRASSQGGRTARSFSK